jgi:CO dehydrogenase maturation factor
MKIAISGKGGSGKTTISATLARLFARRGFPVLAIDGDPNPNLAQALGIKDSLNFEPIPRSVVERREDESGATRLVLAAPAAEIISRHGLKAPDGVTLLVGSRVDHPGAG